LDVIFPEWEESQVIVDMSTKVEIYIVLYDQFFKTYNFSFHPRSFVSIDDNPRLLLSVLIGNFQILLKPRKLSLNLNRISRVFEDFRINRHEMHQI